MSSAGMSSSGRPAFLHALSPPRMTRVSKPFSLRMCATRALVARVTEGKAYAVGFEGLTLEDWPAGEVVIRVGV